MNKKVILIIVCAVVIPLLIIILDLLNITSVIKLTERYDWLGFIGAYISGIFTLILGIISIKQNDTLKDVNQKMIKNDMISNCFSQIELEEIHYVEIKKEKYSNWYGLEMVNIENNEPKEYGYRLILNINDIKNLPLISARIDKIQIEYKYEDEFNEIDKKSIYINRNNDSVVLEVSPQQDKTCYYLPICLLDEVQNIKAIEKSEQLRIEAEIQIKNSFGVIATGIYTFILKDRGIVHENNWNEYLLVGRKIYFKEVMYDGTNK